MISEDDLFDCVIVRDHGHDDFRITGSIRRRIGRARAVASKRRRLFAAAVIDDQVVSGAEQVTRHAHTHFPESNKSEIHNRSTIYCLILFFLPSLT